MVHNSKLELTHSPWQSITRSLIPAKIQNGKWGVPLSGNTEIILLVGEEVALFYQGHRHDKKLHSLKELETVQ